jgi:hypothetical protein
LPLPAILAFSVLGFGGSVFLAYTSFSPGEVHYSAAAPQDAPVYSARAVPFDPKTEDLGQRLASTARALTATPSENGATSRRGTNFDGDGETSPSGPTLFEEAAGELSGFAGLAHFNGANTYLTLTGLSFGIGSQSMPGGFVAPDAETLTSAPVPETSTWICGAALVALVAGRGIRASWLRNRRR